MTYHSHQVSRYTLWDRFKLAVNYHNYQVSRCTPWERLSKCEKNGTETMPDYLCYS